VIFRFPVSGRFARALCAPVLGLALATLVGACGEDGSTPDCPELPRYNIKEDLDEGGVLKDPAKTKARNDAAAKNCITLPGDASTFDSGAD
jgi:hypothetical protein